MYNGTNNMFHEPTFTTKHYLLGSVLNNILFITEKGYKTINLYYLVQYLIDTKV